MAARHQENVPVFPVNRHGLSQISSRLPTSTQDSASLALCLFPSYSVGGNTLKMHFQNWEMQFRIDLVQGRQDNRIAQKN